MSARHLIALLVLLLPAAVAAAVPRTIGWQGVVSDGGTLLQGGHDLTFRLYAGETGGTALWTETQTLTFVDGVGEAVLGSVQSLAAVDFGQPLWLSLAVDGGAELEPRTELTAVPYALAVDPAAAVTSLNGLAGPVDLQAGANVSLSTSGNTVTISSTGGSGGSDGDWNISGSDLTLGVSGNVGIGNNSPNHKLDIRTPTEVPVSVRMISGASWGLVLQQSPSSVFTIRNGNDRFLSWTAAGRFGVGHTAPQALVHLDADYRKNDLLLGRTTGAIPDFGVVEDLGAYLAPEGLTFHKVFNLGESGSGQVSAGIVSNGLGWQLDGIASTTGSFSVNGFLSADGGISLDGSGDVALTLRQNNQVKWTLRNDVSQGDDFQILRSGSSTPVVDIGGGNGTITVDAAIIPNVTYNLGSSSRRWGVVYAMAADIPSDRRLKEEIRDLEPGLQEVLALRPVHFRWKEHPEMGPQMGLIAQELQQVLPAMVRQADDEAGSLSVEYLALLPVLIKALQEQQAQLERERATVAAQAAALDALDARLTALEEGGEGLALTSAP